MPMYFIFNFLGFTKYI